MRLFVGRKTAAPKIARQHLRIWKVDHDLTFAERSQIKHKEWPTSEEVVVLLELLWGERKSGWHMLEAGESLDTPDAPVHAFPILILVFAL